ncbi:MAG TPA: hypothetical protein VGO64_03010 [Candidatus Limnocylindrales bacterium]|jgi:hypothetical protein|nr:hypothetical protein [Candidatus Limnocylindrales bacterium]
MTANRDVDRIVRAWLDLMPDEAPDRAIAGVHHVVGMTPQRRPLVRRWRSPRMGRLALAGALAVIVATAGVIDVARPTSNVLSQPTPAAPSTAPSAPTSGPPLDESLRATWLADADANAVLQSGGGPVSLRVGTSGADISATNFGPGHAYGSTLFRARADEIEVVLNADGGNCRAGAHGVYRWALSADRSILTLTGVADDCAGRRIVLERDWVRSLVGPTSIGAGVVNTMSAAFKVVLPDKPYDTRTLDDFVEIAAPDGFSLMVFKNPQPFVDACSTAEERVAYKPGGAAFVDAFRHNDAFTVSESIPVMVDGHDAIHVTIGGKANYARCPGHELYEYTPKACNCHFIVGQGAADSMYLVDVGTDTYMFIVSPLDFAGEPDVIASIRIPVALPTG